MAARVVLNGRGIDELLHSDGVRRMLEDRAERVAAAARSSAPVSKGPDGGRYRDSIHVEVEVHPTRVVSRVVADVDYAMPVEAKHGTLARALDAAGGA